MEKDAAAWGRDSHKLKYSDNPRKPQNENFIPFITSINRSHRDESFLPFSSVKCEHQGFGKK